MRGRASSLVFGSVRIHETRSGFIASTIAHMLRAARVVAVSLAVAASPVCGGCRPRVPTYHRDVAPILARRCRSCHHPGGVAPVPTLDDYASARMYAQPIRLAMQTRRMPPWGADDTGLCGRWKDARWLTTDEISTIARWQEGGSPEGEPQPSPRGSVESTPFRADATLETGGVYHPGLGPGGYRCFVADPTLDRDRLLTAIRVVASDPRAVAQVTLFALDSAAGEAEALALDAAEPGLGYSCFGTARVRDARLVASWTWPEPVLRMPSGTGVRLFARRKMIVQAHYDITAAGGAFESRLAVELELEDHAREARVWAVRADGSLRPGQRYVAVETTVPVERRLRVVGIAPRMHIRGSVLHLTLEHGERGAQSTCLGEFDHWHFYNQQLFRAVEPARLAPGDRVHLSCAYNTQGRTRPIAFGDHIDDEECSAYLFVTDED
jgi:Copper type II ascorbate-dependent monooxygenase, C-terminal domain